VEVRLWKKSEGDAPVSPNRLQKLSTPDLISWADTEIMQVGAAFDRWRYHNGPYEDVTLHLNNLSSFWQEIVSREVAKPF
jgi:hypothetical protein